MDDLDDIFRSFVDTKLKQHGLKCTHHKKINEDEEQGDEPSDNGSNLNSSDETKISDNSVKKQKKEKKKKKDKDKKKNKDKKKKTKKSKKAKHSVKEKNDTKSLDKCKHLERVIDGHSSKLNAQKYECETENSREFISELKQDILQSKTENSKFKNAFDEPLNDFTSIRSKSVEEGSSINNSQGGDVSKTDSENGNDKTPPDSGYAAGSEKNSPKPERVKRSSSRLSSNHHHPSKRSKRSPHKSSSHRHKHSSRSRSRSPRRHKHHRKHHRSSRSKDHHHYRSSKRRHRERSLSPVITEEDKMRLLEIAKANVFAQYKADSQCEALESIQTKAMLTSDHMSVEQLTVVCRDIVDGKREVSRVSPTTGESYIRAPFQVKEAPAIRFNISSNIGASSSYPPLSQLALPSTSKSIKELSKEFPVSCGSEHQREEVYGKWEPVSKKDEAASPKADDDDDKVVKMFQEPTETNSDLIKEAIAQRIHAVRVLEGDPNSDNAKRIMSESQSKLNSWTSSKIIPGRFTGSHQLQPLSRSELERGKQAWANHKDFNSANKVAGIGKLLLQKMGWKEGEPLGKTMLGVLEPLQVNIKTDRKGLVSCMERAPHRGGHAPHNHQRAAPAPPTVRDLSGKHPVSALMEVCSKRRWGAPEFSLVSDAGPAHQKNFKFRVKVHNDTYEATEGSMNKKLAKAHVASVALHKMGLLS